MSRHEDHTSLAEKLSEIARAAKLTVAVAESLTSGRIASALGASSSSSEWFLGGVVAYSRKVKHEVLGVPPGPVVSEEAARAMAEGVRDLTGADLGASATGAGGPEGQDDQPPGTVFIAVADGGRTHVRELHLDGEPADVLGRTTTAVLEALIASSTTE
ncbi:CinA family protein [Cumulibacter manganitolerans]|uniref:CinA family protein n=1 Tax=Cumulibacter manganitolerans TaxID=1884992 RepID=UPI00129557E3|nr:CinA family protein [Cumulibacter manganitolerans]